MEGVKWRTAEQKTVEAPVIYSLSDVPLMLELLKDSDTTLKNMNYDTVQEGTVDYLDLTIVKSRVQETEASWVV